MRAFHSIECTLALAVGALVTWLDSSFGVSWYATVHATATMASPEEGGHERAHPDEEGAQHEQQASPGYAHGADCSATDSDELPAVGAPVRPPPAAALPAPIEPLVTDPPPAMAGLDERSADSSGGDQ
eukprot:2809236-Pyramimonas_sp.AAC.1